MISINPNFYFFFGRFIAKMKQKLNSNKEKPKVETFFGVIIKGFAK